MRQTGQIRESSISAFKRNIYKRQKLSNK